MKNENITLENNTVDTEQQVDQQVPEEEEFKVTVKKLDMPVKPRGVLAE